MRPLVQKFLPYWKERLASQGEAVVRKELESSGRTIMLTRKDRMELLRLLGLRSA